MFSYFANDSRDTSQSLYYFTVHRHQLTPNKISESGRLKTTAWSLMGHPHLHVCVQYRAPMKIAQSAFSYPDPYSNTTIFRISWCATSGAIGTKQKSRSTI